MRTDFKEVDRRFGNDEATRRSAGDSTRIRRTFCLPGFAHCWREAAIRLWLVVAGTSGLLTVVVFSDRVAAQTPIISDGPPQQVIPKVSEVGMPNFTIPSGMTTPSAGSAGGDSEGTGTGEGENGTGSGSLGSNDALNTMMNQPWGITAINNAEAVGVNPTALAATCVLESGCQISDQVGPATLPAPSK